MIDDFDKFVKECWAGSGVKERGMGSTIMFLLQNEGDSWGLTVSPSKAFTIKTKCLSQRSVKLKQNKKNINKQNKMTDDQQGSTLSPSGIIMYISGKLHTYPSPPLSQHFTLSEKC